jgi:2-keto-4-pentenoate hydratase
MPFDVQYAAAMLVEARLSRRQLGASEPGPQTIEEAYAVQDAVATRLGRVGAWKVGAKGPSEIPTAAPILSSLIRPSPADWSSRTLHMQGVEAEIAFRVGRDLAPRSQLLSRQEVYDAVASVHAAIEIVDTRLADWRNADRLWVLADNQSNGGFVYDQAGAAWLEQDFSAVPVRLCIDGRAVFEGRGGNPAGDPRWLLVWLVNHCVSRRGGLAAGTLITTGSCTGMTFVEPGTIVEAEFSGLGSACLSFS